MTTLSSSLSSVLQSLHNPRQTYYDETTTNDIQMKQQQQQLLLVIQFSVMVIIALGIQIVLGRYIIISKDNKRRIGHMGTGLFFIYYSYIPNLSLYITIGTILSACIAIYYWFYYCPIIYMYILGPFLRSNELPDTIVKSSSAVAVTKVKVDEQNKNDTTNSIFKESNNPGQQQQVQVQVQHSQQQVQQLPGAFWFLLAIAILLTFFPPIICQYCVLCLSICDPLASFIGTSIPSSKVNTVLLKLVHTFMPIQNPSSIVDDNTKTRTTIQQQQMIYNNYIIKIIQSSTASIYGSIACFISSWIIGYMSLPVQVPINSSSSSFNYYYFYVQITIGAIACTISEAYPIINDNISIPIVTAITITILS